MWDRRTAAGRSAERIRLERELERELDRRRKGPGQLVSTPHRPGDLALCPCCGRDLVYPVDWSPATARTWSVTLRCPECEWRGGGVYGQDLLDRFDEALDQGTQSVLDDLDLLTRSNMEDEVRLFVRALEAELILPEDF
jgi:hypothetical protein